jgi:hypothetical protein
MMVLWFESSTLAMRDPTHNLNTDVPELRRKQLLSRRAGFRQLGPSEKPKLAETAAGSSRRCDCASIDDASGILFYGPELDRVGKRLRAFFASPADGPFGRIVK